MKLKSVLFAVTAAGAATLALASPAGAAAAGPQSFVVLATNPANNAHPTIAATGVLHARGSDTEVSSNSAGTKGVDRFSFPKGSLTVAHAVTKGTSHDSFDRTTCFGTHTERGSFTVTGGTRSYTGASGSGSYSLSVLFFGCSQNKPPTVFQELISAHGTLKL